ncbi:MAG: hydrogenase nickel incorporation protein HypA [bacterium]|nr:hydrogenase nickel incorporation protein HypA [bacterium]
MHEWALAEAVVSTALGVAEKEKLKRIDKIKIKMGELQQIDTEIFRFALKEIVQCRGLINQTPTPLRKAKIEIGTEKAILKCRVCEHNWAFGDMELNDEESESIHFVPEVAHAYIKCPKCGSPDFEFIKGRGIFIESIEGTK